MEEKSEHQVQYPNTLVLHLCIINTSKDPLSMMEPVLLTLLWKSYVNRTHVFHTAVSWGIGACQKVSSTP